MSFEDEEEQEVGAGWEEEKTRSAGRRVPKVPREERELYPGREGGDLKSYSRKRTVSPPRFYCVPDYT